MTRREKAEAACRAALQSAREGAYEVAAAKLAESREFFARQSEDKTAAQIYIMEGVCCYMIQQPSKAEAAFQAAEAIARRLKLADVAAVARYNLAVLAIYTDDHEKMQQFAAQLLPPLPSGMSERTARLCKHAQAVCAIRTGMPEAVLKMYHKRSPPADAVEAIVRAVAHSLSGESRTAEHLLNKSLADESIDPTHRAQLLLHLSVIKGQHQGDVLSARDMLARAMAEARRAASVPQRDFQQPSDVAREVKDATAPMLLLEQAACRTVSYCVSTAIQNWAQMRGGDGAEDPSIREAADFMRELHDAVQQLQPLPERPAAMAGRLVQLARELTGACQALTGTEAEEAAGGESEPRKEEGKAAGDHFHFERLTYPAQHTMTAMDGNVHRMIQSIGGLGMGFGLMGEGESVGEDRLLQLYHTANNWMEAAESDGDEASVARLSLCISCVCLRLRRVLEAKRLALKSAELAGATEQYGLKALAYRVCTDVAEFFPSDDEENTLLRLQLCKQFLAAARQSQIAQLIRDAHQRLANCYIDIAEGRASVGVSDVSPDEIVETVQSSEEDIAREEINFRHLYCTARARANEVVEQMLEAASTAPEFHPRA